MAERGITLVALVITIIVLLILAGVSISLVVGNNGVLTQATNAVEKNREAQAREEVEMAWASATTDYWNDWTKNSSTVTTEGFYQAKLNDYLAETKAADQPVGVTGNGDGTLSTNVSYSDEVFTNIYERVDVNVGAVWNDKDNEFKYRPESIVVRLYADGVEIDHAIVRESDGWKCVFPGLDKYMDGKKVNYTISEDKFFGYIPTIHKNAENDYVIIHDLAPIGGGDPNDFVVTQAVSNVHIMNPRTGAYDHVAICLALSFASICTMIVATKRYNNSKNK